MNIAAWIMMQIGKNHRDDDDKENCDNDVFDDCFVTVVLVSFLFGSILTAVLVLYIAFGR